MSVMTATIGTTLQGPVCYVIPPALPVVIVTPTIVSVAHLGESSLKSNANVCANSVTQVVYARTRMDAQAAQKMLQTSKGNVYAMTDTSLIPQLRAAAPAIFYV